MDRPDEVTCYKCGQQAGWAKDEHAWFCVRCRIPLKASPDGRTSALPPALRSKIKALKALDASYTAQLRNLHILSGGTRYLKPKKVPPQEIPSGFIFIMVPLILSPAILYLSFKGYFVQGAVLSAICVSALWFLYRSRNQKADKYERIQAAWTIERERYLKDIRKLS